MMGMGDAHYDTISAFIKSMRGSDPDATLYWLAKNALCPARIQDSLYADCNRGL